MKKILALLTISLLLVSCGKTPFHELSLEKQAEIQTEMGIIMSQSIGDTTNPNSMKETMNETFKQLEEKYSDVDFSNMKDNTLQ